MFFLLFKDLEAINSSDFMFHKFIPAFKRYNDMAIENVLVLYQDQSTIFPREGNHPCSEEANMFWKEYELGQYLNIDKYSNYLPKLIKSLKKEQNSLIILCSSYFWRNFQHIAMNLEEHYFSDNTWLLIDPIPQSNLNPEEALESKFETSDFKVVNKIKLNSQIYIFQRYSYHSAIYEIYSPCPMPKLTTKKFINLTNKNEIFSKPNYIWERRQNLTGCEITVGYVDQPYGPFEI